MASEKTTLKTLAQTMAEFTFALRYDAIPPEVKAAARRHLADTLACALGARAAATVLALRKHAIAQGGRADATIIGMAERVPAGLAALVNGTMVRFLDANDIFVLRRGGASGHFSDATAALLALAERYRRSGEELLTCIVASYELQGALAESLNFWERGLHPLTNVAWVAPIVAARLVGATAAEAVHACGLSTATGTVLNTWIRPAETIPVIKSVAVGLALERAVEVGRVGRPRRDRHRRCVGDRSGAFKIASPLSFRSATGPTTRSTLDHDAKYAETLSGADQHTGGHRGDPWPLSKRHSRRASAKTHPPWPPQCLRRRAGLAPSLCAVKPGGGGP